MFHVKHFFLGFHCYGDAYRGKAYRHIFDLEFCISYDLAVFYGIIFVHLHRLSFF